MLLYICSHYSAEPIVPKNSTCIYSNYEFACVLQVTINISDMLASNVAFEVDFFTVEVIDTSEHKNEPLYLSINHDTNIDTINAIFFNNYCKQYIHLPQVNITVVDKCGQESSPQPVQCHLQPGISHLNFSLCCH